MPTIDEIRQKYPQYGDMSDTALADAMHSKFYADMPREEFNTKIGLKAEPLTEQRSGVGDIIKSFPRGLLGGLSSAASAGGEAAVLEMGQQDTMMDMPSKEQVRGAIEQNVTGELPKPQGRLGRVSEAVGETLGNPASYVGPGSLALKVGAGAVGATAGEAAGQLFEGSAVEAPARIIASIIGGGGTAVAATERNIGKITARIPTREDFQKAANAAYKMLEQSNTRITPEAVQFLSQDIQSQLLAARFRDYLEPQTFRALQELASGEHGSVGDVDTVRQLLVRIGKGNPAERAAANRAIEGIDNFLANIPDHYVLSGNPTADAEILRFAQKNWSIHKQLEEVEEATTRAQHRAGVSGSGGNRINTARQEIRKILDSDTRSRGMSQAVKDQMEKIIMGTWSSNLARRGGKFAPEGPVSALPTILADIGQGHGAAIATAGGGFLSRWIGEYLTDRQIAQLEQLMRRESPLSAPIVREIEPQLQEQTMVPAAQAARSALTSPLAAGSQ